MCKTTLRFILVAAMAVTLVSCAAQQPVAKAWKTAFTAQDLDAKVKSGDYEKKVDNFLVVLDASGSMAHQYKGKAKVDSAKDIVSRMNQTIPDIGLVAGLRVFGKPMAIGSAETRLIYGMNSYSEAGMEEALGNVWCPRGESPLQRAVNAASEDLSSTKGKSALIIVSDGDEKDMDYAAALTAVKTMKGRYGDRLCIYTILIGNDPKGKGLLEKIAQAGDCGFSVSADEIADSNAMADFVEKVFLARVEKVEKPTPPPPPPPKPVVPPKILDSDQDGVPDDLDRCPGTPLTAKVDKDGCWVLDHILFDFDKAELKAKYHAMLDEVVSVMRQNPSLKMGIHGHTCNLGDATYNKGLSVRRAKAVMAYFVRKGIAKERLMPAGYGPTKPVASNLTKAGRALNRRAELYPTF
jgi:OOP family OmpA-OmpF porin